MYRYIDMAKIKKKRDKKGKKETGYTLLINRSEPRRKDKLYPIYIKKNNIPQCYLIVQTGYTLLVNLSGPRRKTNSILYQKEKQKGGI